MSPRSSAMLDRPAPESEAAASASTMALGQAPEEGAVVPGTAR
jgi:hypothetical protein